MELYRLPDFSLRFVSLNLPHQVDVLGDSTAPGSKVWQVFPHKRGYDGGTEHAGQKGHPAAQDNAAGNEIGESDAICWVTRIRTYIPHILALVIQIHHVLLLGDCDEEHQFLITLPSSTFVHLSTEDISLRGR